MAIRKAMICPGKYPCFVYGQFLWQNTVKY
jgi:hypothetical protein